MAAATTTSVSAECPEYILFLCRILIVTSPKASIPSVTDFTENSINSLGTLVNAFRASQTASTGPVPTATAVSSVWSSVFTRVTVAVGLDAVSYTHLTLPTNREV